MAKSKEYTKLRKRRNYLRNRENALKHASERRQKLTFEQYRSEQLRCRYKMTIEQYNKLVEIQNNKCAICDKEETNISRKTNKIHLLSVDHCHKTGIVRGLLCHKCNKGIGLLQDNYLLLYKAYLYLKKKGHKDATI